MWTRTRVLLWWGPIVFHPVEWLGVDIRQPDLYPNSLGYVVNTEVIESDPTRSANDVNCGSDGRF